MELEGMEMEVAEDEDDRGGMEKEVENDEDDRGNMNVNGR